MSLICPISNRMFSSQSAPKELLDPNKCISKSILYLLWHCTNCIKLAENHTAQKMKFSIKDFFIFCAVSTRSGLESKTQTLYFWNNYSKLVLKNYIGVLQHDFWLSNFLEIKQLFQMTFQSQYSRNLFLPIMKN